MPDPTQTPGFFSQAGSFLKDIPSALVPGENAGRTALMIWAASKGPQALIGVSDYFNQQDMQRFKTVSDPEYQDYVSQLEQDKRASGMDPAEARRQAIADASKVYVGAKGFVAPEALSAVDAAPGGPSLPDRIKMPQLPPPDKVARMKVNIATAQENAWNSDSVEGQAFRDRTTVGFITPGVAAELQDKNLNYTSALNARHPGQTTSAKVGKNGPEFSSSYDPNANIPLNFPIYDRNGERVGEIPTKMHPAFLDMDLQLSPDGTTYTNRGWRPDAKAAAETRGKFEGKWGNPDAANPADQPIYSAAPSRVNTPNPQNPLAVPIERPRNMSPGQFEMFMKDTGKRAEIDAANEEKRKLQERDWNIQHATAMADLDNVRKAIVPDAFLAKTINKKSAYDNLKMLGAKPIAWVKKELLSTGYGAEEAKLARSVTDMLSRFARSFGGEKGVLTEADVGRMRSVLPDASDGTMEQALSKIAELQEYMDEIMTRRRLSNWAPAEGDRLVDYNLMPIEVHPPEEVPDRAALDAQTRTETNPQYQSDEEFLKNQKWGD